MAKPKKRRNPVSAYMAKIGKKGGSVTGKKGFAAIPPERQKEIRAKAAEARRKQAKKKGGK